MNSKMIAGGIALVFVAMAVPTNAYHIVGTGTLDINNPHAWTSRVGVSFPDQDPLTNSGLLCPVIRNLYGIDPLLDGIIDGLCTDAPAWDAGDGIFGFTVCEQNTDVLTGPGHAGFGGLCSMNPGFTGNPCSATASRSNGAFSAYNGGACKTTATDTQPTIATVARKWTQITMQGPVSIFPLPNGTPAGDVKFLNDCGSTGTAFVYDEQYYYTMFSGHVSGFPSQDVTPNTFGTYTAATYNGGTTAGDPTTDASLTACGGPVPAYTAN
ncbi:MAG: hypothetical protein QOD77_1672 [Thermoplasmata archaeon]|jgi:hypothetical protein|nr:hypothetical protein [Thermoplasmata archaeon]